MSKQNFPFEVGQLAEARSNELGYRGAWFRCKIKGITSQKHKGTFINVEYYDYPDEKPRTVKLYQKFPSVNPKSKKSNTSLQMMMRPCFPPVYRESQLPDISGISKVVVAVKDSFSVGDQVDWYTDGCFWTGRITEILSDEKVQLQLPPPPAGEGLCYEAFTRDMRPSLVWSLEDGWSLPSALGSESCHHCARLITPTIQGIQSMTVTTEIGSKDSASDITTPTESDVTNTGGSSKNSTSDTSILLNSTSSDTLEAAVLDLEELVNRVYWLKGILDTGMTCSRPSWKFIHD